MARTAPYRQNPLAGLLLPVGLGIGLAVLAMVTLSKWGTIADRIAAFKTETTFYQPPVFMGQLRLGENNQLARPYDVLVKQGIVYVSFLNTARVDRYDSQFKYIDSINLSHGENGATGFAIDGDYLYAADAKRGELRVHTGDGTLAKIFAWQPDGALALRPYSVFADAGILYATDRRAMSVMAIMMRDVPGQSEAGEMLFNTSLTGYIEGAIPGDLISTPDGRLLVSDVANGDIAVFTCNGRYVSRFSEQGKFDMKMPMGIALDQIKSPDLLKAVENKFVVSGVEHQGRIHVVDGAAGDVKVFDATGTYVLSYGETLVAPRDIAIDQERRLVMIIDSDPKALLVYKY